MTTISNIVASLTADLDAAGCDFKRMPSACNWKALTRAMLAYQQIKYLEGSEASAAERAKVLVLCNDACDSECWPELVVGVATGRSLDGWTYEIANA